VKTRKEKKKHLEERDLPQTLAREIKDTSSAFESYSDR